METDEEWCSVGEELAAIVWRRVHKLFTSDCVPAYTTYRMSNVKFLSIKSGFLKPCFQFLLPTVKDTQLSSLFCMQPVASPPGLKKSASNPYSGRSNPVHAVTTHSLIFTSMLFSSPQPSLPSDIFL
jgi:hypothetical protein